ncbi:helix-turn-helix domain-containing protein [Armatimonas sp.]|uniref:helix-turn-helix domain-containing protein n=1 Tax=Armatimonas sp. TaxID=1872638 RepID=UPI00286ADDC8|nr:helix-turn-helix domain-containing protein [Armatimonas sp.]
MQRAETSKRLTFSQKWGDDPFTQSGHTQVPNALITYAHRLGLKSEECWLITCILRFKYDDSNPTPSQERLAELFGQSVDTVQRTIKKIVDKRLLKVERFRDEETHRFTHTVYDFTPLRFSLNECHYQDHPEERPQMPTLPEKATPQICGLEFRGSHTAVLRPGPHRRTAVYIKRIRRILDSKKKER